MAPKSAPSYYNGARIHAETKISVSPVYEVGVVSLLLCKLWSPSRNLYCFLT